MDLGTRSLKPRVLLTGCCRGTMAKTGMAQDHSWLHLCFSSPYANTSPPTWHHSGSEKRVLIIIPLIRVNSWLYRVEEGDWDYIEWQTFRIFFTLLSTGPGYIVGGGMTPKSRDNLLACVPYSSLPPLTPATARAGSHKRRRAHKKMTPIPHYLASSGSSGHHWLWL